MWWKWQTSLLYPIVCSLICTCKYVYKGCIAWTCNTNVITKINKKVKWPTHLSIDTNLACLSEHDGTTKPSIKFNELCFINPSGVWPGNLVHYIQNLLHWGSLYQGSTIQLEYISVNLLLKTHSSTLYRRMNMQFYVCITGSSIKYSQIDEHMQQNT